MLQLEQVIRLAHSLEPLPASAVKLASLVAESEPDFSAIATVIERDPALTLALLRRANSAAVGANRSVATVRDAITLLGAAGVLQLLTRVAARSLLSQALPEYGLAAGKLWDHSRAAATAVELISQVSKRRLPPETSTTALLHDIGKLVLARFLSPELRELIDRSFLVHRSYRVAESEVLGVSQAELGGLLAERWRLPLSIVHGITYCQQPADYANRLEAEASTLALCQAVHFANFVAKCWEKLRSEGVQADSDERTATATTFEASVIASMEYLSIDPVRFSALLTRLAAAMERMDD